MAHIALAVADQARSRRFYETYFEFDPETAWVAEDGVLLIDGPGDMAPKGASWTTTIPERNVVRFLPGGAFRNFLDLRASERGMTFLLLDAVGAGGSGSSGAAGAVGDRELPRD